MDRVVVWDLEIQKSPYDPDACPNGWEDARTGAAGISSVVLWDSFTGRYHLYDEHMLDACAEHLNSATLLVGFNNIGFDTPCFEGFTGSKILVPQADILKSIWGALGRAEHGVWGLDKVAYRTIGIGKSGSGAHAPELYKDGRWGELFDYNLNDVFVTKELHNFIVEHGHVVGPDHKPLRITNYAKLRA